MEVSVSAFRADLARWIARAGAGDEIVITERGGPVARLIAVASTDRLTQLTRDGVLSAPRNETRPRATGRPRVSASHPVSELVTEQRR